MLITILTVYVWRVDPDNSTIAAEDELLTLRRAQPNSHNVMPRGGYQPRGAPSVRDMYNAYHENSRRARRIDIVRQNRLAKDIAEIALPVGDGMDDL